MVYDARIVMVMPPEMGASRPVSSRPLMCASSALGLPSRSVALVRLARAARGQRAGAQPRRGESSVRQRPYGST
jgi:hypothetical protein